jgi:predicted metal-binding membrane protein
MSVSAAAWAVLAMDAGGLALPLICASGTMWVLPSAASFDLALALNPFASLAKGWMMMLGAMMGPLLIAPVRHVRDRSFARRRVRAIALFIIGYAASWGLAGIALLALALAVRLAVPGSLLPSMLVLLIAIAWQMSPAKQSCLNRCDAQPTLSAFGIAADLDALRFGATHGAWCVGSCWALMLLPLLVSHDHLAAMAAVALWVFAERLNEPLPPRWCWRWPGKAVRIAVMHAQLAIVGTSRGLLR